MKRIGRNHMKTSYLLLSSLIMLSGGSVFSDTLQSSELISFYVVEAVEDGDTLVLKMDGKATRVQILGIDAPESSQNAKFKLDLKNTGLNEATLLELGEASTAYMQSLLTTGEQVSIQGELRAADRYGRIPAIVKNAADKDLGETMVLEGYAVMLDGTQQDREYIQRFGRIERIARKSNKGLWGSHREPFRLWYDRTR